jgi:hypothetical protein
MGVVACIRVTHLTAKAKIALSLADNHTSASLFFLKRHCFSVKLSR